VLEIFCILGFVSGLYLESGFGYINFDCKPIQCCIGSFGEKLWTNLICVRIYTHIILLLLFKGIVIFQYKSILFLRKGNYTKDA